MELPFSFARISVILTGAEEKGAVLCLRLQPTQWNWLEILLRF